MKSNIIQIKKYIFLIAVMVVSMGCKKFIEVDIPSNMTNTQVVYNSDATAISSLTGIYSIISKGYPNGYIDMSLLPELSSDNLKLFSTTNESYLPYYRNMLTPLYNGASSYFWTGSYQLIYSANAAIEGLNSTTKLTPSIKQQLLGEAYFIRGFLYYYLVNLYGEVPLVLKTDYTESERITRNSIDVVYNQILADLKLSEEKLSENYLDGKLQNTTSERVRPCKPIASALLARVYLFKGDFPNAELYSSKVINNSNYELIALNQVFLKNSKETIWALQPVVNGQNTKEALFYNLPSSGPDSYAHPVYLSDNLMNKFESGDVRKITWTKTVSVGNISYPYPTKYNAGDFQVNTPPIAPTEYSIVMRLAEQYLIRSEARAQQNNITGSKDDLNLIRQRASLDGTLANTKVELLRAILEERRVELFTEWGHRWLDLKRTGKVNDVMSLVTPTKEGGIWRSEYQYYPIPQSERNSNPNLTQNPGYSQ